MASYPSPGPHNRGGEQTEKKNCYDPVHNCIEAVRTKCRGGVSGGKEHVDTPSEADFRLLSTSKKRCDRSGPAEYGGETEQCEEANHEGVGQLLSKTSAVRLGARHDCNRSTTITPEMRPMSRSSAF
ncbi:hypothetical protein Agsp01_33330 [Agromyces sp. NBRC 114283]|nr:hypothetical protein Agsp01_33330 [Agromyces sp. NBRC 114283]